MVELYLYSPMGRTAYAEPQCLYEGVLYFTYFRGLLANYLSLTGSHLIKF